MKLQKLVYYSQAWSLVWDEQPLFSEPIEAWNKGPVVSELWKRYTPSPSIGRIVGDASKLSEDQRAIISVVLAFYGGRSGEWLSELTHREPPWIEARANAKGVRNPVITPGAHAFASRLWLYYMTDPSGQNEYVLLMAVHGHLHEQ